MLSTALWHPLDEDGTAVEGVEIDVSSAAMRSFSDLADHSVETSHESVNGLKLAGWRGGEVLVIVDSLGCGEGWVWGRDDE